VPLSLRKLTEALRKGSIPKRSVVITFDDGYADNFYQAKPLLEKYEIPATVFVAGRYVTEKREFWWDEIEQLLFTANVLPRYLKIVINGQAYLWDLEEFSSWDERLKEEWRDWNVLKPNNATPRHLVYRALCDLLKPMDPGKRDQILKDLWHTAKLAPKTRNSHRPMTPEEIYHMAKEGLIEIGAHTLNHPQLSALTPEEQEKEIVGSCQLLQDIIGKEVIGFAYPFGGIEDFDDITVNIVQRAGFKFACTTFQRPIRKQTSLLKLPRFLVRNWDGDEFAKRLKDMSKI